MYFYTYTCHEDEKDLCETELRTLLDRQPPEGVILAEAEVDASRSPFVKERIHIRCEGASLTELAAYVEAEGITADSFKVETVRTAEGLPYEERLASERFIGSMIQGTAEMRSPLNRYGLARYAGRWYFGPLQRNGALWLAHNEKVQHYSTALSTRVARAVVNLAVPRPEGVRAIDPCCGIGTVVLEALSMGIDMVGSDINPLAVMGARENLAAFGYPNVIRLADVCSLTEEHYDALVLDLPYNIASKLSDAERDGLLQAASRLADRAVIVSVEPIDQALAASGWQVVDQCAVRKGSFRRDVFVCVRGE